MRRQDGKAAERQAGTVRPGNKSRGPISIFGPIFKVEDRSEDPDLRIADVSRYSITSFIIVYHMLCMCIHMYIHIYIYIL